MTDGKRESLKKKKEARRNKRRESIDVDMNQIARL